MGVRGVREKDPTPEEIELRAAEIRRKWSKTDERLRASGDLEPYRVQVVSPNVLAVTRPIVKLTGY